MRFMMMYKPAQDLETAGPPSCRYLEEMNRFIEEGFRSGKLLETNGLQPRSKGARIQMDKGQITVMDGPFAEAKEVIAGYALVQTGSREEAIEIAKRFLAVAGDGETEVRQLYEAADFEPAPALERAGIGE